MQRIKSISTSLSGRCAMFAGCALAGEGVVQVVHSQRGAGTRVVGLAGNLTLALTIIGLAALAPVFVALARYGRTAVAEKAALAAAGGVVLLAIGCLTSIINQHDLAFFPGIAAVANLAWLGGSITLAVSLVRSGRVPTAIAVGLPLTWIFSIPLATMGGALLAGGYFLAVGYLLFNRALEQRGTVAAVAVS